MADNVHRPVLDACEHGGHVPEFVLHPIGRGVAAAAAAAAIHGVDREMALQSRDNGSPAAVVRGGAVNQQNRRAMAAAKIADGGAVFGSNAAHACSRVMALSGAPHDHKLRDHTETPIKGRAEPPALCRQ
jgi:hypothetical protein